MGLGGVSPWIVLASLALAPGALANETIDPFELSPEQLFEADVISASRTQESVWEAPAAISVITGADIERAGATTLAEALRLAPGVQVARTSTSGWAVSVRGFNSSLANKLLVLVDGRESYDPLFSGVYWDVQDTVLEDIERIEIIRGPGAALWGANAVNGVINIITRRASETTGVLVSAVTGDTERASLTARYGASIGEALDWRVYGRLFDRAGQSSLAGGDDNSAWQAWRGGFRADMSLSEQTLTLQGDAYRSETGQRRLVSALSPPYATLEAETIVAEGANLLARWTNGSDNEGRWTAQAYVDFTRRNQALLKDRRTTFDLDVQYEWQAFGVHDLIAGLRYRHSTDVVIETEIITSPRRAHRSELLSAFIQDQITLAPNWRLTLGSKFDDNHYSGFEVQPSARLQWSGADTMVWTALSRAVRSPSELEREFNIILGAGEMSGVLVTAELLPSPDFGSEELLAFEAGMRQRWSNAVATDLALFRNEYDGLATLTTLAPMLGADPIRIILAPIVTSNDTNATTQGAEFSLDWRIGDTMDVVFNWSVLDIEMVGPPAPIAVDAEVAEGQSPAQQGSLRVSWRPAEDWSLDASLYHVGALPAFSLDAYTRADLRVGYRLTPEVTIEVVGQNLFDDEHREFGNPNEAYAAAISRNVFGRLTWRP